MTATPEVLFVGEDCTGSRAAQRLRTMREMGMTPEFIRSHPADEGYETPPSLAKRIRYRLRLPADAAGVNDALLARMAARPAPDVLWIDYVVSIRPSTLRQLRSAWPETRFVWYSEDDMMRPRNGSIWIDRSIPYFDLWVTTKSLNALPNEMPARGVSRVMFVNNSYDEATHQRPKLSEEDKREFRADVSFVGTYEQARAESMVALARAGIRVRVWGNHWPASGRLPGIDVQRRPVYGAELAKVYAASAINLAFLRKVNRDLQTCRTVEIPACSGFMLHERTDEARVILAEDTQASYFEGDDELISQCRRWLADPEGRRRVAEAGWRRIRAGGFTHRDRLREIFRAVDVEV